MSNNVNTCGVFERKLIIRTLRPEVSRISDTILNLDQSVNSLNGHVSRLGLGIMHRSAPRIICSTANRAVMFTGISTLSSNSCNILCSISYRPVILRAVITRQRTPHCVSPILWTRPRPAGTSCM